MILKRKLLKKSFFKLWDPDFTKLTLRERISLQKSEREIKKGEYFTDEEVWK